MTLKEYRILFINLIVGLVVNAALDVPLMHLLSNIGLPAYYGATLSTILGNVTSIMIVLSFLKIKYGLHFKETVIRVAKIILSVLVMLLGLNILKLVIPFASSRMLSFVIVCIYALVGIIIYYVCIKKFGLLDDILGKDLLNKFKNKFKRKAK